MRDDKGGPIRQHVRRLVSPRGAVMLTARSRSLFLSLSLSFSLSLSLSVFLFHPIFLSFEIS